MLVYVAAPYPARQFVELVAFPKLEAAGHRCTSSWALASRDIHAGTVGPSLETDEESTFRHAQGDLFDVGRSDALFSLTASYLAGIAGAVTPGTEELWLHTGGRHVELGYAAGLPHSPILVTVGPPENIFQRALTTLVPDLDSAILALA